MADSLNPTTGIGYSELSSYEDLRVSIILDEYSKSLDKLRAISTNSGEPLTVARSRQLAKQIDREVNLYLSTTTGKLSDATIKKAYELGYDIGAATAEYYRYESTTTLGSVLNTRSTQLIIDQLAQDTALLNKQIETQFTRYLSLSSQQFYVDKAITQNILESELRGLSGPQSEKLVLQTLKQNIVAGNLINVAGRLWNVNDYASLLVRTRTSEAVSRGTLNAAIEYGMDLVQIDIHGDACPLCQTKMGRVFSISGKNPDFPLLESFTPFHPNCRCHMFPITIEALETRGRHHSLSQFSKNTPNFNKASDANKWLANNPRYAVIDQNDMIRVYGGLL